MQFYAFFKILFCVLLLQLLVCLPSFKVINDYKTLLSACWSCQPPVISTFPQTSCILYFFCLSIGGNLIGNVLLLVTGFHMLHFCMLDVGYFMIWNVHGLVVWYKPILLHLLFALSLLWVGVRQIILFWSCVLTSRLYHVFIILCTIIMLEGTHWY